MRMLLLLLVAFVAALIMVWLLEFAGRLGGV